MPAQLSRTERAILSLTKAINETRPGRFAQNLFLRGVGYTWMRAVLSRRMLIEGLDEFRALDPDRGVLLVANHRSFFDLYAVSVAFFAGPTPWIERVRFPVKADFFYERPLGFFTNLVAGGGVMYPPFFRQRERVRLNRASVEHLTDILGRPGWLVGYHPEGTRNKTADPYWLLPMQPGVGELALKSQAIVVPVFINGLSNNIFTDIKRGLTHAAGHEPCICVFGRPINTAMPSQPEFGPRAYKMTADIFGQAIADLAESEKRVRLSYQAGEIAEHDGRWLKNQAGSKLFAFRRRPKSP